jgi:hypothetical protein
VSLACRGAFAAGDLPLDRVFLALPARVLTLVRLFFAFDPVALALLGGSLALVGKAFSPIGDVLAPVRDPVALVRPLIAIVGDRLALAQRTRAVDCSPLTFLSPAGASLLQFGAPGVNLSGAALDLRAASLDLCTLGPAALLGRSASQPLKLGAIRFELRALAF